MSRVDFLLQELEKLDTAELWAVWDYLQQKIRKMLMRSSASSMEEAVPAKETAALSAHEFSFAKTRRLLAGKNLHLGETVIEERRSYQ
ncbi:hypothetical protein [Rhodoflexus caldus]|uniref:hypothetical protein n=1 Tax=Rhodoflexus caldus TaxID=2891236 RepID=UPI00202A92A4|nr:hypothetical protein [Rhodoflexus caldus]